MKTNQAVMYFAILIFVVLFATGAFFVLNPQSSSSEVKGDKNATSQNDENNTKNSSTNITPNPSKTDEIGRSLSDKNQSTPQGEGNSNTETSSSDGDYQDGDYSAVGSYNSPGGIESLKIDLTIKDGIVTKSKVEGLATNPTSKRWQGLFVDNYKSLVEGKNIDEIELDVVSGSSLTANGFNDALMTIKEDAQKN